MAFHSHQNGYALPTPPDLKNLLKRRKGRRGSSSIIAVTQRCKHIGYVFLTIKDLKKAKGIPWLNDVWPLTLLEIKELGVNIRLVPLSGYCYNPKTKKFGRKTGSKGDKG